MACNRGEKAEWKNWCFVKCNLGPGEVTKQQHREEYDGSNLKNPYKGGNRHLNVYHGP